MIDIAYKIRLRVREVTDLIGWIEPVGVKTCLCGADGVLWVQEDYTIDLSPDDSIFVVPDLIFQRCSLCKETYLNHKARQRIERVVNEIRRSVK